MGIEKAYGHEIIQEEERLGLSPEYPDYLLPELASRYQELEALSKKKVEFEYKL